MPVLNVFVPDVAEETSSSAKGKKTKGKSNKGSSEQQKVNPVTVDSGEIGTTTNAS